MRPAPVVLRDPLLPHQIVISTRWGPGRTWLYVSCNCLRIAGEVYEPLEVRELWEPGEAAKVWRKHMAQVAGRQADAEWAHDQRTRTQRARRARERRAVTGSTP